MRRLNKYLSAVLVALFCAACSTQVKEDQGHGPDTWQFSNAQSQFFVDRGEYGKALEQANLTLKRVKAQSGKSHPDVSIALSQIARIYALMYNHRFAESHYRMALKVRKQAVGTDNLLYADSMRGLGTALYHQQKYAQAQSVLESALATAVNRVGWKSPQLLSYLRRLARAYEIRSKFDKAVPLRDRAVVLAEQKFGAGHPELAEAQARLAYATTYNGNPARAAALFERSLPVLERHHGANSPQLAMTLDHLGAAYSLQKRYSAAEPVLSRALSIRKQVYGQSHLEVANSYERLADLYKGMGRAQDSFNSREKANKIRNTIKTRI